MPSFLFFFLLLPRWEGKLYKTLEVYTFKTLEVYTVKTLEVYTVKTLEVYTVKTLEVYNVKTLEVSILSKSLEVIKTYNPQHMSSCKYTVLKRKGLI